MQDLVLSLFCNDRTNTCLWVPIFQLDQICPHWKMGTHKHVLVFQHTDRAQTDRGPPNREAFCALDGVGGGGALISLQPLFRSGALCRRRTRNPSFLFFPLGRAIWTSMLQGTHAHGPETDASHRGPPQRGTGSDPASSELDRATAHATQDQAAIDQDPAAIDTPEKTRATRLRLHTPGLSPGQFSHLDFQDSSPWSVTMLFFSGSQFPQVDVYTPPSAQ